VPSYMLMKKLILLILLNRT